MLIKAQQKLEFVGQTFDELTLRDVEGATFTDCTFNGPVAVYDSSAVRFVRPVSHGDGSAVAFTFRDSEECALTGGVILRPKTGVKWIDCRGGRLASTTIAGMAVDGCDVNSCQDIVIEDCVFGGNLLRDGHHPDAGQMWNTEGHARCARISWLRNLIGGDMQGISSHGSMAGVDDVLIAENVIDVGRSWAIHLQKSTGMVRDNVVRTIPDDPKYQARIGVCAGVVRKGNVVAAALGKRAVVD